MNQARKERCVPSENREQALRYIKHILRDRTNAEQVSLDEFTAALQKEICGVCSAFQQMIFSEHETFRPSCDIEQSLSRFRGLFSSTTPFKDTEYAVVGVFTPWSNASTENKPDLYSIKEVVSSYQHMLITDLYFYLSRNSNKRQSMLTALKLLSKKYSEELKWMTSLERRCIKVFGGKEELTADEFHRVIDYQKELSDKIFRKFDKSQTGTLNIHELYDGLVGILTSNTAGRLRYLFDIYDKDGNGTLKKEEVDDVLRMCISESRLQFHEDLVNELSNIVWNKITAGKRDHITFDEFYNTLRSYPSVYNNLNINVMGKGDFGRVFQFLDKREKTTVPVFTDFKRNCSRLGARFTTNRSLWIVMVLYIITTTILLGERIYTLIPRPMLECWYVAAKSAGQLLNFNIAFGLMLTLKHTATKLRKFAFLRRFVPFDDILFLHKMVAYMIVLLTIVHVGAHGFQIGVKLIYMEGISHTYYMDGHYCVVFWAGVALIPLLLMFVIGSLPSVRNYSYELFMRTHQFSTVIWLVLMVLHAKNFWKWMITPLTLVVVERTYFFILMIKNRTLVETGVVHGNITQLTIKRPRYFKFSPGDYVNINIPEISRSQWHPFTISSSPDHRTDRFTLHIRKVGNWTGKLHSKVLQLNKTSKLDNPAYVDESLPPDYMSEDTFSVDEKLTVNQESQQQEPTDATVHIENEIKRETETDDATDEGIVITASCALEADCKQTSIVMGECDENQVCLTAREDESGGNDECQSAKLPASCSSRLSDTCPSEASTVHFNEAFDDNDDAVIKLPELETHKYHNDRHQSSPITTADSSCHGSPTTPDSSVFSIELTDLSFNNINNSDACNRQSTFCRQKRFSSNSSKELKCTPVERKMLRSSSTADSLESILESRRAALAGYFNNNQKRSLSLLSREGSRSSIIAIPVDEAPELNLRIYLDGPYSTPSQSILNTKHAILVAGGIGITPFASILESIINLLKADTKECHCSTKHKGRLCKKQSSLERIDFFWVTRDQSHLSWFHQVFKDIEEAQAALGMDPPLVNLHIYLTGLKRSEDIRGAFLQLALEMIYQEDSLDVLSGLKAKTKPGRPDWKLVLREITKSDNSNGEKRSRPKLFACGPNTLCDELKRECYKQDIVFKEEVF